MIQSSSSSKPRFTDFYLLRSRHIQGFSLVELMVVVGIIGILTAIAVPTFRRMTVKARQAEAVTTLSHIIALNEAYMIDAGGALPSGSLTKLGVFPWLGDTDCHEPWGAKIGFKPRCRQLRFGYIHYRNTTYTYHDAAWELVVPGGRSVFVGCPSGLPDIWIMDHEKNVKHTNTNFALVHTEGYDAGPSCL